MPAGICIIGLYDDIEKAGAAYLRAAERHFGEFAERGGRARMPDWHDRRRARTGYWKQCRAMGRVSCAAYERLSENWRKDAGHIEDRYQLQGEGESAGRYQHTFIGGDKPKFNILWSNIQTMLPALFSKRAHARGGAAATRTRTPSGASQRRFSNAPSTRRWKMTICRRSASAPSSITS